MKESAHQALRKGEYIITLKARLTIQRKWVQKGAVLSSTKESLLMKDVGEEYVSADNVAALIKSNALRLEEASPHGSSKGVPGFKVADLEKVTLHYFRTSSKTDVTEADVNESAREEIERGRQAAQVAGKIAAGCKKGTLTAEELVELMFESKDRKITKRALRGVKVGESTIVSPLAASPYFSEKAALLPGEVAGARPHRVRIEVLGPTGRDDMHVKARVIDPKDDSSFWTKVGTTNVLIEETDIEQYKVLLLSALVPGGLDVELAVRVDLPLSPSDEFRPRGSILAGVEGREIVTRLIKHFQLQLGLFDTVRD